MIDLHYESVSEFKKIETTKLIKKSINICIKEMHLKKNFTFQFLLQIIII